MRALKLLIALGILIATIGLEAQGAAPRYMSSACPLRISASAQQHEARISCGRLVVAEDRQDRDSDTLASLFVLRIAARAPAANAPIIYLEGGPGSAASERLERILGMGLHDAHDIIVMDQRGAGLSRPSLNCPERDEPGRASRADWLRNCYQRLEREGVALDAYNIVSSADDILDLMNALDIRVANIYGLSYGARLANTLLRENPQRIRAAVLDGVYPFGVNALDEMALNTYAALERLFTDCSVDPRCRAAFPRLREQFYRAFAALNDQPAVFQGSAPDIAWYLDGADFVNALRAALADTSRLPELPALIATFASGAYDDALWVAAGDYTDYPANSDAHSEGAFFSQFCPLDAAATNEARISSLAADLPPAYSALASFARALHRDCALWDVPAFRPAASPKRIAVPVLLLSGRYDPITPPAWAEVAAAQLPNSWHYVFPGAGHGVVEGKGCATTIMREFLANPDEEPSAGCFQDLRSPRFRLPGDIPSS